jgi:hypothetical protein
VVGCHYGIEKINLYLIFSYHHGRNGGDKRMQQRKRIPEAPVFFFQCLIMIILLPALPGNAIYGEKEDMNCQCKGLCKICFHAL